MKLPKDLADAGFDAEIKAAPRSIIMTLGGREKGGKSDFCLRNVPDPIGFVNIDKRAAHVLNKFKEAKTIYPITLTVPQDQDLAIKEWTKYEKAWYTFINSPNTKGGTISVDTYTETWELGRIAEFGPSAAAKPHHYRGINAKFNKMLDDLRDSGRNGILIYKMVETYENEKPTGEYRPQGFKNALFKSDLNATIDYDDGFKIRVDRCGLKASLNGAEFEGEECSFAFIASKIYKGTTPEQWGQL